jgi:hypothetical protein
MTLLTIRENVEIAKVFYYDGSNWAPRDSGLSNIAVYHNQSNNTFRVVALDGQNNQVCYMAVLNWFVNIVVLLLLLFRLFWLACRCVCFVVLVCERIVVESSFPTNDVRTLATADDQQRHLGRPRIYTCIGRISSMVMIRITSLCMRRRLFFIFFIWLASIGQTDRGARHVHHRTDQQQVSWGLNFASPQDAETFAKGMEWAINTLKGGGGAPAAGN